MVHPLWNSVLCVKWEIYVRQMSWISEVGKISLRVVTPIWVAAECVCKLLLCVGWITCIRQLSTVQMFSIWIALQQVWLVFMLHVPRLGKGIHALQLFAVELYFILLNVVLVYLLLLHLITLT